MEEMRGRKGEGVRGMLGTGRNEGGSEVKDMKELLLME